MPELPEVETMRRGIRNVAGATIAQVERVPCRRRPIAIRPRIDVFRRRAVDAIVAGVSRVGKRIVLELSNDQLIVIEPRMTGLVLVTDPPTHQHLRWRMVVRGTSVPHLMYWDRRGLGSVSLMTRSEFAERFGDDRLGPDALSVTGETLRQRLGESRRAVKVALLDQRAIAGIGNLYASEILHVAKIHPGKPCHDLTRHEWRTLAKCTSTVLTEAIRYEGSTLNDGTYRNALNQRGNYQNCHRVYDKASSLCQQCRREKIVRIVQAQRATFFCPRCQ